MSTFETKITNKNAKGNLTLYKAGFGNTDKYYARVDRDTVTMENIIARIMETKAGANEIALRQAYSFLKDEVLKTIAKCESISLFDIGTLYVSVEGGLANKASDLSELKKKVRFTPSALLNEQVEDITFDRVSYCESEPYIASVTNLETQEIDSVLNIGKGVLLTGERLKLVSDQDKVFFAPVTKDGIMNEDESTWTACGPFYKNTPKNLMFLVPPVEKGEYIIVVKSYSTGFRIRKYALYGYSNVVTVE